MLESLGCLESSIAELAAERDAFSAAFRLLDRIVVGGEKHNGTEPEEIQQIVERFVLLRAERDYFAGYEADLVCIRKTLDEHDAPHDCEEGTSLEPTRIRLLANQRDAAVAKCAELERIAEQSRREGQEIAAGLHERIAGLERLLQAECRLSMANVDAHMRVERMLGVLRSDLESTNAALAAAKGKLGELYVLGSAVVRAREASQVLPKRESDAVDRLVLAAIAAAVDAVDGVAQPEQPQQPHTQQPMVAEPPIQSGECSFLDQLPKGPALGRFSASERAELDELKRKAFKAGEP